MNYRDCIRDYLEGLRFILTVICIRDDRTDGWWLYRQLYGPIQTE